MKSLLHRCRLQPVLVIPFVGQMIGLVGLVGWLSFRASHHAVTSLGTRLMLDVSGRVAQYLDSFSADATLLHRLAIDAKQRQDLDLDLSRDNPDRDQLLLQWIALNEQITWVSLGSEAHGDYHGAYRTPTGELQVVIANDQTQREVWYYPTDGQQRTSDRPVERETGPYDSRSRPWYQGAYALNSPVWSDPYEGYSLNTSFISFSAPLVLPDLALGSIKLPESATISGSPRSLATAEADEPTIEPTVKPTVEPTVIMAVDIALENFNAYLQKLVQDVGGEIVIINRQGEMMATSLTEGTPTTLHDPPALPQAVIQGQALIHQDQNLILHAVGHQIQAQKLLTEATEFPQFWPQSINNQRYWVSLQPYSQRLVPSLDSPPQVQGAVLPLDWFTLIIIPESSFMAGIHANTRTTILLCLLALGMFSLTGAMMARWIVRPLEHLSAAAQDLAQGNLNRRVQIDRWDELRRLEIAFNNMAQQLRDAFQQIEAKVEERTWELAQAKQILEQSNGQLKALAILDSLTQIPNRRCFDETLTKHWQDHRDSHQPLSLILVDIDYFKQYNDCYGHLQGDHLLRNVAQLLTQTVQQFHTLSAGLVARYGGEEFAILLPQTAEPIATQLAQRLCTTVAQQEWEHRASDLGILTISLGLATLMPETAMAKTPVSPQVFPPSSSSQSISSQPVSSQPVSSHPQESPQQESPHRLSPQSVSLQQEPPQQASPPLSSQPVPPQGVSSKPRSSKPRSSQTRSPQQAPPQQLIQHADQALYHAKHQGRNQVAVASALTQQSLRVAESLAIVPIVPPHDEG
ncbi:MAG: diguanylate cyclase domain-containing protein [Prochlorothrix sp.]